jgi:hypothetical protein
MKITEQAAKAILQTMVDNGLDPNKVSIFFDQHKHGCALEFTLEDKGKESNHYGLKVQVSNKVNFDHVMLDYTEAHGKRGLIFCQS